MPFTGIPWIKPQFFTDAGAAAAGYKLFSYDVGGLTKRSTYTTAAGTSANTNPIVLDDQGRASIYLLPQQYRFILATPAAADPPLIGTQLWDMPKVSAFATGGNTYDAVGVAGEALAANEVCYLSDGSGSLTAGRWYKADSTNNYSSIGAVTVGFAVAAITSGTAGTFRRLGNLSGFTGLTVGATYYISNTAGAITTSPLANVVAIGRAQTDTVLAIGRSYGDTEAGVVGLINTGAQSFAGQKTFSLQPIVFIGTVSTTATVGGVYTKDVTLHSVPVSSSNVVMTDSEIPANFMDVDGRQIAIWFGTTTDSTIDAMDIKLDVGGTITTLLSFIGNPGGWAFRIVLTRLTSSTLSIGGVGKMAGDPTMTPIVGAVVTGLNFTASIDLRTLATTGSTTTDQTYYLAKVIG